MFLSKFITKLKYLINPKSLFGGVALVDEIEFAFELNGKKYYKFVNELNTKSQRGNCYFDVVAEISQKIDNRYLTTLFENIIICCNKGDLSHIAHLTKLAQQRMDNITILDSWYKIASILYFDESENPYHWDYEYNEKKINEWKRHGGAMGFFSMTHLNGLTTFLDFSEKDMQDYQKGQMIQLITQLRYRLANISESEKNSEKIQKLKSDVNIMEQLISLPN